MENSEQSMDKQSAGTATQSQFGNGPATADQLSEAMKAASDQARDLGEQALERTGEVAKAVGETVKEYPITTLAAIAGLAFAVGALWKMGHSRPQSRMERLLAQLPELPRRQSLWSGGWR